jgi:hypothetical protein
MTALDNKYAGAARGATAFEHILTAMVVAVLVLVVAAYYQRTIRLSREVALQAELANLRTAVQLYFMLNRKFPEKLEELEQRGFLMPHSGFMPDAKGEIVASPAPFQLSYLEGQARDSRGQLLDPFGRPYRYNPDRGTVQAGEARYRSW